MDQKLTDWVRDSRPIGAPAQPNTFPEAYLILLIVAVAYAQAAWTLLG
jgi:hypothetical protein